MNCQYYYYLCRCYLNTNTMCNTDIDNYSIDIPAEYLESDFDDVDVQHHFDEEETPESNIDFDF